RIRVRLGVCRRPGTRTYRRAGIARGIQLGRRGRNEVLDRSRGKVHRHLYGADPAAYGSAVRRPIQNPRLPVDRRLNQDVFMPLDFESQPLRELRKGRELQWDPHAIDLAQDRTDWTALDTREQSVLL